MKCFSSSYGYVRYIISCNPETRKKMPKLTHCVCVCLPTFTTTTKYVQYRFVVQNYYTLVYIMAIHTYTQVQLVLSQELLGDGSSMYSGKLFGGLALTQSMAFANRVHQGVEGQNETQVFYIIILKKIVVVFWQLLMMKGKCLRYSTSFVCKN